MLKFNQASAVVAAAAAAPPSLGRTRPLPAAWVVRLTTLVVKLKSQTDHLRALAATVRCGSAFSRYSSLWLCLWSLQFVMVKGLNILRLQRGYLRTTDYAVRCV